MYIILKNELLKKDHYCPSLGPLLLASLLGASTLAPSAAGFCSAAGF